MLEQVGRVAGVVAAGRTPRPPGGPARPPPARPAPRSGCRRRRTCPGWNGLELPRLLREEYGPIPIAIGDDVKGAVAAELRGGSRRGVYLNPGTGLPAALVVGGEAVAGAHGAAGRSATCSPSRASRPSPRGTPRARNASRAGRRPRAAWPCSAVPSRRAPCSGCPRRPGSWTRRCARSPWPSRTCAWGFGPRARPDARPGSSGAVRGRSRARTPGTPAPGRTGPAASRRRRRPCRTSGRPARPPPPCRGTAWPAQGSGRASWRPRP